VSAKVAAYARAGGRACWQRASVAFKESMAVAAIHKKSTTTVRALSNKSAGNPIEDSSVPVYFSARTRHGVNVYV
jgi:hypothetical protein